MKWMLVQIQMKHMHKLLQHGVLGPRWRLAAVLPNLVQFSLHAAETQDYLAGHSRRIQ